MTRKHLLAGLAAVALAAIAMPAQAAPVEFTDGFSAAIDAAWTSGPAPVAPAPAAPVMEVVAALPAPAQPESPAPAGLAEPAIAQEDLADLAGQGDAPIAVLTEQTLQALNSGNTVIGANVGSGAISIDQNAFSGFDGIGNFVINSGHNNTLQSSLSVSIVVTP
jgi:hypothetical protein